MEREIEKDEGGQKLRRKRGEEEYKYRRGGRGGDIKRVVQDKEENIHMCECKAKQRLKEILPCRREGKGRERNRREGIVREGNRNYVKLNSTQNLYNCI